MSREEPGGVGNGDGSREKWEQPQQKEKKETKIQETGSLDSNFSSSSRSSQFFWRRRRCRGRREAPFSFPLDSYEERRRSQVPSFACYYWWQPLLLKREKGTGHASKGRVLKTVFYLPGRLWRYYKEKASPSSIFPSLPFCFYIFYI